MGFNLIQVGTWHMPPARAGQRVTSGKTHELPIQLKQSQKTNATQKCNTIIFVLFCRNIFISSHFILVLIIYDSKSVLGNLRILVHNLANH